MKEAMIRIMDFAFNELKLRRLNVYAFKENKGSNALVKRLGFINEGMSIKKSKSRATGKIHDDMIYGMLKSDWENAKKKLK